MGQLNSSFGSGGMTLALNDAQFGSFIHFIKESFRCNKGAVVKKAACVIGLQPCGNYWVFGENAQVIPSVGCMRLNQYYRSHCGKILVDLSLVFPKGVTSS